MKPLLRLASILFVTMFFAQPSASAQTGNIVINNFKLTHMTLPDGGRIAPLLISGQGINLSGQYNHLFAPRACMPCRRGTGENPEISRRLFVINTNSVSGVINGVNHERVYLAGELQITALTPAYIPMSWAKRLKLFVPVTLTGSISGFKLPEDIVHPERAIFSVDNVSLQGTSATHLFWILGPGRPLYWDSFLEYSFAQ